MGLLGEAYSCCCRLRIVWRLSWQGVVLSRVISSGAMEFSERACMDIRLDCIFLRFSSSNLPLCMFRMDLVNSSLLEFKAYYIMYWCSNNQLSPLYTSTKPLWVGERLPTVSLVGSPQCQKPSSAIVRALDCLLLAKFRGTISIHNRGPPRKPTWSSRTPYAVQTAPKGLCEFADTRGILMTQIDNPEVFTTSQDALLEVFFLLEFDQWQQEHGPVGTPPRSVTANPFTDTEPCYHKLY